MGEQQELTSDKTSSLRTNVSSKALSQFILSDLLYLPCLIIKLNAFQADSLQFIHPVVAKLGLSLWTSKLYTPL